jgi:hypothetical protein
MFYKNAYTVYIVVKIFYLHKILILSFRFVFVETIKAKSWSSRNFWGGSVYCVHLTFDGKASFLCVAKSPLERAPACTKDDWFVEGLYTAVSRCTQLYPAVPSCIQLYPAVPSCTQLYPAVPSCTQLYPAVPS